MDSRNIKCLKPPSTSAFLTDENENISLRALALKQLDNKRSSLDNLYESFIFDKIHKALTKFTLPICDIDAIGRSNGVNAGVASNFEPPNEQNYEKNNTTNIFYNSFWL